MRDLRITIERHGGETEHTRVLPPRGHREHRAKDERTTMAKPNRNATPWKGPLLAVESRALVLGGAKSVWRDVAVLETMIDGFWPGLVIAVNDVGCVWPRRLDHWVTLHHEKLALDLGWRNPDGGPHGWLALRDVNGHPDGYQVWGHVRKGTYAPDNFVRQWDSGSSGLLGVALAYQLGCTKVVLAGVPMDDRPHFAESVVHHPRQRWTSVRSHWEAWRKNLTRLRERTRSLSGRTRAELGAPSMGWLMDSEMRRAA